MVAPYPVVRQAKNPVSGLRRAFRVPPLLESFVPWHDSISRAISHMAPKGNGVVAEAGA